MTQTSSFVSPEKITKIAILLNNGEKWGSQINLSKLMGITKSALDKWSKKTKNYIAISNSNLKLLAILYVLDYKNLLNEDFLLDVKKVENYLLTKDENLEQQETDSSIQQQPTVCV